MFLSASAGGGALSGQDDARLVRPGPGETSANGQHGAGASIRQTFTALTKRLSVRHQERPPGRPTVARASTFHVTPAAEAAPAADGAAAPDTNPFRQPAAGASPHRQRRRHNPFLESPRPGAPTPPPPPIPSSPPPPYDSGEQILEVSPAPPPPPPPPAPHAPLTAAARSSEGDAELTPSDAPAEADRSSAEAAAVSPAADGAARGAQAAEPPPKPPRTPEAGEEPTPPPADRPAPVAEPEPSTVSGVYPSLPSVPESESTAAATGTARSAGSPAADAAGSIDRNKSNREDQRPYEEISYKKENGDFNGDVPSGEWRPGAPREDCVTPRGGPDPTVARSDPLPPVLSHSTHAEARATVCD